MRKQVIHTILLSGFLGASGFAQTEGYFGGASFAHLQSCFNAIGRNTGSAGYFQGAWRNTLDLGALDRSMNRCASARAVLLDVGARNQGGQHFHEMPVPEFPAPQAFFFISGMTIDADGAPNAYNPDDTGLDELANAGAPGRWNGIITDRDGNPLIQQERDPFPGYYISCTSLSDESKKFSEPTRYVDASKIPYIALPQDVADRGGARLGDFAVVMNLRNRKSSFAIYADIGTLGEGSIALANALGIRSDARHGGESGGVLYLLFSGSGNLRPRTIGEIQSEGERLLLDHWREMKKLSSCLESDDRADGRRKSECPEYTGLDVAEIRTLPLEPNR